MGHNGPNNIGTHSEDVPRSLNADMSGEGWPTDKLWMRYRTELAGHPSHPSSDRAQRRGETVERHDTPPLGLWTWLRRLGHAGVSN